jgi:DNA-binding FrmR family transcriptional regulator
VYVKLVRMTTSRNSQTEPVPGYSAAGASEDVLKRLRRIEGQVRGIAGMVEDERYCIDVLQQISAAQAALDKVALALVDEHVRHCVMGADPSNQEEKHAELMTALGRLVGRR